MNSLRSSALIALTAMALAGFVFSSSANTPANGAEAPPANLLTGNPRLQQLLAEANRASGPEEIIRLADSGADASVIQTYVETSGRRYELDAEQIIQLHQRGVSAATIAAMIRRSARPEILSPVPTTLVPPVVVQAAAPAPQPTSSVTYIRNRPRYYYPAAYRPLYVSAYYPYAGCAPTLYGYGGYGGFGSYYYRPSYWNYRPAWWSDFRYRGCW